MDFKFTNHPQINSMLIKFQQEIQPFRKVHRMIDLFETIIKTHTSFIIGSYFQYKNISDEVKGILAHGLKTPSLGTWQLFSRVIMEELVTYKELTDEVYGKVQQVLKGQQLQKFNKLYKKQQGKYLLKDNLSGEEKKFLKHIGYIKLSHYLSPPYIIKDYYQQFYQWDNEMQANQSFNVIEFRNGYAHGATPRDEDCIKDIERFNPALLKFLSSPLFSETTITHIQNNNQNLIPVDPIDLSAPFFKENHPYLLDRKGNMINLFPMMYYENNSNQEGRQLFFLNDLKRFKDKGEVTYLNYPEGIKIGEKDIREDFLKVINLEGWRNKLSEDFRDRIEELTETFKGRIQERRSIRKFIKDKNQGILMIYGKPGIGKSSLIAQMIKELKLEQIAKNKGSKYHIIDYFIRRGSEYGKPHKLLSYLNGAIEAVIPTALPAGKNLEEQYSNLGRRLSKVSEVLKKKQEKVILFIDGLDEGIDETDNILAYLPKETYKNIFILYSSRKTGHTEDFYYALDREKRMKIEIPPLSKNDIRAILYETVNKYQIMDQEMYIEKIASQSEGNPLYMKLLCLAIENGETYIDDGRIGNLPKKIDEFYEGFLRGYRKLKNSNLVLEILFIFACSKDSLTKKQLELISKSYNCQIGITDIEEALLALAEVIDESPVDQMKTGEGKYQLFHETFRQYLKANYSDQLIDREKRILQYCKNWSNYSLYSLPVQAYPLKYYSEHLRELGEQEELYQLIEDNSYLENQIVVTQEYCHSLKMFSDALSIAQGENNGEQIINIAIKVAKLHNDIEESPLKIRDFSVNINANNLELALNNLRLLEAKNAFPLYLNLLDDILTSKGLEEAHKKDFAQRILKDLDNNCPKDLKSFNWDQFYPFYLMIENLKYLYGLGVSLEPISSRVIISQNLFPETEEEDIEKAWWAKAIIDGFIYKENSPYGFINSFKLSNENLQKVCNYLIKLKEQKNLLSIANKISDYDIQCEVIETLITSMVEEGRFQEGKNFLPIITDDLLLLKSKCIIAQAMVNQGQVNEGLKAYDTMVLEHISAIEKGRENILHKLKLAKATATSIGETNLYQTHPKLYKNILKVLQLAEQLRISLKKEQVFITGLLEGILELGSSIALGLAKNQDHKGALELIDCLFEEEKDNLIKVQTLSSIAKIMRKQGLEQESIALYKNALDIEDKNSLYFIIDPIAEDILNEGLVLESQSSYNTLLRMVSLMDYLDWRCFALLDIANILLEVKEYEEAQKILQEVTDLLDNVEQHYQGGKSDVIEKLFRTKGKAAMVLAETGNYQEAWKLLEEIKEEKEFYSKAIVFLMNTITTKKDYREAKEIYATKLIVQEDISRVSLNNETIIALATAMTRDGHLAKALTLAQRIGQEMSKLRAQIVINIAIAEGGDYQQALKEAEKIEESNMQGDVIRGIDQLISIQIDRITNEGDFQQGLKLAELLNIRKMDSLLFIGIKMELRGYVEKAKELYAKLLKEAEAIKPCELFGDNISQTVALAKVKGALGSYKEAIELSEAINLPDFQFETKNFLVKVMALKEDYEDAYNLAETIDNHLWRAGALNNILEARLLADQYQEAENLYPQIIELTKVKTNHHYYGDDVANGIAKTLIKAGYYKEGLKLANPYEIKGFMQKFLRDKGQFLKILEILDDIKGEEEKVEVLLSIIRKALGMENLPAIIRTVEKTMDNKEVKRKIYKELLMDLDQVYQDIPTALTLIIPNIQEDFELLNQSLNLYIFYYRYISDANPSKVNQELRRFAGIRNIEDLLLVEVGIYQYDNWQSWIDSIENQEVQEVIEGYIMKVQRKKMTKEEFVIKLQELGY